MRGARLFGVAVLTLLVAGCDKPAEDVRPCLDPVLTPKQAAGTWGGERERAQICVEVSSFQIARKGGPVSAVGPAAVAACADKEASALAALASSGPVYPYQRKYIADDYAHLASVTAVRARSLGCGARLGAPPAPEQEGECAWWWCSRKK
jgi:hypothetical protein